ncbi:hypothetical protein ACFW2Y_15585 [Streptomyces sp. NPDC058877]|uniref:hypothetical protein n=1 Tax=unclassified Streptomyces TaxID=2593676 RepID=UPI0036C3DD44
MTEQIQDRPESPVPPQEGPAAEAVVPETEPRAVVPETVVPEAGPQAVVPEKPRKSRRPLLWGVLRWTAAVLVCGGIGAGTALGITAVERTEVPGLGTEPDGRWEYPRLSLPALPEGALRPFTDGNDGEIHHADLRKLLLPAPKGATVDPKLKGGWVPLDSYLALLAEKDRGEAEEHLVDSALRHVAARGWTMPDGTTTRIHLLRFSSVAFSEEFKDEATLKIAQSGGMPFGVESSKIDMSVQDVTVPGLSVYAYAEEEPYGPEQTRWAYVQAGDTVAVVTQTRKGGTLTVPFQQTVALQAQLLG